MKGLPLHRDNPVSLPADQVGEWQRAIATLPQLTDLMPIDAKACSVVGLVRNLIESAGLCLSVGPMELAAFVLASETTELMGRAVRGDDTRKGHLHDNLTAGLGWLVGSYTLTDLAGQKARNAPIRDAVVIQTAHRSYTVDQIADLRNFATHGGAVSGDMGEARRLDHALRSAYSESWRRVSIASGTSGSASAAQPRFWPKPWSNRCSPVAR